MRVHSRRGFTLVELIIVVLVIGLLTAIAVPQYLKTIETSKADDAVAMVNMIGTTNKMFALDHNGAYASGSFDGDCDPSTACPTSGSYGACALVWCKYLANQKFSAKPYVYYACDGTVSGACNGVGSGNQVATGKRRSGTYSSWSYGMTTQGTITGYGTDVPTPTY